MGYSKGARWLPGVLCGATPGVKAASTPFQRKNYKVRMMKWDFIGLAFR